MNVKEEIFEMCCRWVNALENGQEGSTR